MAWGRPRIRTHVQGRRGRPPSLAPWELGGEAPHPCRGAEFARRSLLMCTKAQRLRRPLSLISGLPQTACPRERGLSAWASASQRARGHMWSSRFPWERQPIPPAPVPAVKARRAGPGAGKGGKGGKAGGRVHLTLTWPLPPWWDLSRSGRARLPDPLLRARDVPWPGALGARHAAARPLRPSLGWPPRSSQCGRVEARGPFPGNEPWEGHLASLTPPLGARETPALFAGTAALCLERLLHRKARALHGFTL